MAESSWKPYVRDVFVGIATLVLILVVAGTLKQHRMLMLVLIGALGIGAAVAVSRREPAAAWRHGWVLGLSVTGPILLLALIASGARSNPGAWLFVISALISCSSVAWAAAVWKSGQRGTAVVTCAVVAGAIWVLWTWGLKVFGPHARLVRMDKPLPELGLKRMDGSAIAAGELQGHVTVLNFWGTWCPGCVEEMPMLQDVAAGYASNRNVQFLLVNSELNGDEPDKIAAFLRRKAISIPAALDPSQSFFKFNADLFPTTVVIDRRGHMRFQRSGETTAAELHAEVDGLLAER